MRKLLIYVIIAVLKTFRFKKSITKDDLEHFIMAGGSFTLKEFMRLTGDQRDIVIDTKASSIAGQMLYFKYLLLEEGDSKERKATAKTFENFDGGDLDLTVKRNEAAKTLRKINR